MWPDKCTETAGEEGGCARTIEEMCSLGDHRRCSCSACAAAARWHEPVRRAGVAAARTAGVGWAVVSTTEDRVTVVGTTEDLARATTVLRPAALTGAGYGLDPEGMGLVYVVCAADGSLL